MLAHSDNTQTQPQSLETVGRLIDLDHAKVDYGYKFDEAVAEAQKRVPPTEEQIRWVIDVTEELCNVVVNAEISKSVCVLPMSLDKELPWEFPQATVYVGKIVRSLHFQRKTTQNSGRRELTLEDLRLVHWQTPLPPRFNQRELGDTERIGTIPYMSHELLDFSVLSVIPHTPHSIIHDMESLFWVLLYLCLTRKGPGGDSRDELFDQPAPLEKSTWDLLLIEQQEYPVREAGRFDPLILHHIHPYFNDVKPILREWWRILCLGFKRYDDAESIEYIYTPRLFRLATSKWLQNHPNKVESEEPYIEMMKKEDMRRRKDQMEILEHVADICGPERCC
ncbi:hypothetical protein K435DRAFT_973833 [Dendrothele bispora CBS 962.96]|uniref:Fungal-type protein kinase domain-containing protein n=1 Tax=Dendrothele bispora (strain CBS 962.96) TaxID=1314807 RepID=A0A4S8KQD0_DENBC|nr:hypothetical protein K435DRAFT_973833 [Dendrothele bispora CBS 962.96]